MAESNEKEPDAGPLGKVLGILADIEHIIRYLLSGAAICALWLASRSDWKEQLKRASDKPSVAATIIITVGFACYTLYRAAWWTVFDWLAYRSGGSAAAANLLPKGAAVKDNFVGGYASFLFWRYSGAIPENLSRYLLYRWAVCHFGVLTGLSGFIAIILAQDYSLISDHRGWGLFAASFCLVVGAGQACWLYRFEHEMRCQRPAAGEILPVCVPSEPRSIAAEKSSAESFAVTHEPDRGVDVG